jgi:hypothetical protein
LDRNKVLVTPTLKRGRRTAMMFRVGDAKRTARAEFYNMKRAV